MAANGGRTEGWYPDPFGRHELRLYDGRWTGSVRTNGRTRKDPPAEDSRVPTVACPPEVIEAHVARADAATVAPGGGTLLTEPVLVFAIDTAQSQVSADFAIFDPRGRQVGAIREVGQTRAKNLSRLLTVDFLRARNLQVVDMSGVPQLVIKRLIDPVALFVRARFLIAEGSGLPIGEIAQEAGRRLSLSSGGRVVATLEEQGLWRGRLLVRAEPGGDPVVAEVSSRLEAHASIPGARGTLIYVLRFAAPVDAQLRRLLIAAPAVIDTTRRHVDTMAD